MAWIPNSKVWRQGLPAADLRKLEYALEMCSKDDPFAYSIELDPTVDEVCLKLSCQHLSQVNRVA